MSKCLQVALFCVLCNIAGLGQSIITVPYQKSTTFPIAGATAAYSLDSNIAEATVAGEVIEIYGKSPGTTHVIVVTSGGVQSFSISVPQPPPILPANFIAQQSENGDPLFGDDFKQAIRLKNVLAGPDLPGGTAPAQVKQALQAAKEKLSTKKVQDQYSQGIPTKEVEYESA